MYEFNVSCHWQSRQKYLLCTFLIQSLHSNPIYKCEEREELIKHCVQRTESIPPQQIASTLLSFLHRWASHWCFLQPWSVRSVHGSVCISSCYSQHWSYCLTWYVMFSFRRDFPVQFDGETPTSVFHLLQKACFQMNKTSKTSAAKASQQLYQGFVYTCFMWGEYVSANACWVAEV